MNERLFVYGTLKSGRSNHYRLGNSQKIGEGYLYGFKMSVSMIPFVWYGEKHNKVFGEIYDVPKSILVNSIDVLEGHPQFYRRTWITDQLDGVWIYLCQVNNSSLYTESEVF